LRERAELREMRLWTLHPRYLDAAGLVAAWREGLLAQAVLSGRTSGYTRHPQLERFKRSPSGRASLAIYLVELHREAEERGYSFVSSRIEGVLGPHYEPIAVNRGQLLYEQALLAIKLEGRGSRGGSALPERGACEPNPAFALREGGIEDWERPRPDALKLVGPLLGPGA
jgi:hypothetical protein